MTALRSKAFTLVEILIVVVVIASIIGFFALNMRQSKEQLALSQGEKLLASLLQTARSTAILNSHLIHKEGGKFPKITSRLIIAKDPANPKHYLRYVGIIYGNKETDTWWPAQGGVTLPEGLYIAVDPADYPNHGQTLPGTMYLQYPEIDEEETSLNAGHASYPKWAYIEFDQEGAASKQAITLRLGIASPEENNDHQVVGLQWDRSRMTELTINHYGQIRFSSKDYNETG